MAFVTLVVVQQTRDADVGIAAEAVHLQRPLVFVALLLDEGLKPMVLVDVLVDAVVAQRLAAVFAPHARSLQLPALEARPTHPLTGREQVGNHVLHGEVDRQRFDASIDRTSTDRAIHLQQSPQQDMGLSPSGLTSFSRRLHTPQEARISQRDRATLYDSRNLVNCAQRIRKIAFVKVCNS